MMFVNCTIKSDMSASVVATFLHSTLFYFFSLDFILQVSTDCCSVRTEVSLRDK